MAHWVDTYPFVIAKKIRLTILSQSWSQNVISSSSLLLPYTIISNVIGTNMILHKHIQIILFLDMCIIPPNYLPAVSQTLNRLIMNNTFQENWCSFKNLWGDFRKEPGNTIRVIKKVKNMPISILEALLKFTLNYCQNSPNVFSSSGKLSSQTSDLLLDFRFFSLSSSVKSSMRMLSYSC